MKLFMAIPHRINFLQLGRYGRFSGHRIVTPWRLGNSSYFTEGDASHEAPPS